MRKGKKEETEGLCYFLFSNIFLDRVFFLTIEKEKKIQRKKSKYKRKGKKKEFVFLSYFAGYFSRKEIGKTPRAPALYRSRHFLIPSRRAHVYYDPSPLSPFEFNFDIKLLM